MAEEQSIIAATTVAAATEIAKNVYKDIAHPALSATGNVLAIIPKAVERALLPVQQWVAEGQYKLAETKKMLALKLEKVAPEQIVSPEPHIAVPALQAISYSMDNEEIRNMYANLLASSMSEKVKNDVHPAFVEIIKQLSPDEARILKFLFNGVGNEPIIHLRLVNKNTHGGFAVIRNFTQLFRKVENLEQKDYNKVAILLDNLSRQKLIEIHEGSYLTDSKRYEPLEQDGIVLSFKNQKISDNQKWDIEKTYLSLTYLGKSFCQICIADEIKTVGLA